MNPHAISCEYHRANFKIRKNKAKNHQNEKENKTLAQEYQI